MITHIWLHGQDLLIKDAPLNFVTIFYRFMFLLFLIWVYDPLDSISSLTNTLHICRCCSFPDVYYSHLTKWESYHSGISNTWVFSLAETLCSIGGISFGRRRDSRNQRWNITWWGRLGQVSAGFSWCNEYFNFIAWFSGSSELEENLLFYEY